MRGSSLVLLTFAFVAIATAHERQKSSERVQVAVRKAKLGLGAALGYFNLEGLSSELLVTAPIEILSPVSLQKLGCCSTRNSLSAQQLWERAMWSGFGAI